jgi:RimJ/RimL family protein N-acetyltransferase
MARRRDVLRTWRLLLRPYTAADAAPLADAIGQYDVARWLGLVPYPYRLSDAEAFIARTEAGRDWLIEHEGRLIGGISVGHELGYWVARDIWGQGLATEACDAATDAHFANRSSERLISGHYEGNERSAKVLEKQGFRYTGATRSVQSRALSQTIVSREMVLERAVWEARRRFRLKTPRLSLRELREGDLPALRRIGGQPDVARMLSSVPSPWPEEAAHRWLLRALFRGRLGYRAAICRWGRVIGTVGNFQMPDGTVHCAYFVDPAHWGRGYATEALIAFLHDTVTRFGVDAVWADHFADNPASAAVLARAGFRAAGNGSGTSLARRGEHPTRIWRLDAADLPAP